MHNVCNASGMRRWRRAHVAAARTDDAAGRHGKDGEKVRARARVRRGLGQGHAYVHTGARQALRATCMDVDSAERWRMHVFSRRSRSLRVVY